MTSSQTWSWLCQDFLLLATLNNRLPSFLNFLKIYLKKTWKIGVSSTNSRKEKANARENGTSFCRRTLTSKSESTVTTFSSKDKENNSSRSSTRMKESWWNATRGWPGCSRTMIRNQQLSFWSSRCASATRRSRVFYTTTRLSGLNWEIFSLSMTKSKGSWRISCASGPLLTLRNTPQIKDSLMAFSKTPRDLSKELRSSKIWWLNWSQSNQRATSLRWSSWSPLLS